MTSKKIFIGIVVAIVTLLILGGIFAVFNSYLYTEKQKDAQTIEPYYADLSGTIVCLPNKNQDEPQTKECALGLRTNTDEYYGLDFSLAEQAVLQDLIVNQNFSGSGVVTLIEDMSDEYLQKYNIQGVFLITRFETTKPRNDQVNVDPVRDPEPILGACYIGGCSSEICTDQADMASNCMYKEEYACYQQATCERQVSGQCGWTQTDELNACIANASSY